jgi:predicted nucleic acid-binding protein
VDEEIFVDSGGWVALADTRDQFHSEAIGAYPQVLQQWKRLVTTDLVIAEAYNMIRRRLGHAAGIRFLESLRRSLRLVKVYCDAALETQAEAILRRYDDQDFSFADAVSFAVMQERGIAEAFAFDRHFLAAGFALVPAP